MSFGNRTLEDVAKIIRSGHTQTEVDDDVFPEDVFPEDVFPSDVFPPDVFPSNKRRA